MKINHGKYLIAAILFSGVVLLSMVSPMEKPSQFESLEQWDKFVAERMMHAPPDQDHLFPTASRCVGCHGFDPDMTALVDIMGNDVNIHDDWSTSMMANSAKDPFWRAKVSHETLINPTHQIDIETKCTSCHAPQGHFTALLRGAQHYSMAEMAGDTIATDGVSCGACHMKAEKDLEKLFSGEANYDTNFVAYGPYEMPFAAPMADFVGFTPLYSEHINSSGICASCHTLLTETIDLDGNLTGNEFVEQATYHEWVNSIYDDEGEDPTTCQGCHMPRLEEGVVISDNFFFLQPRAPFGLHDMIGSNTTMIELIKNNKNELDIEAADEHFDETIAKTLEMLQKRSVDLSLSFISSDSDSAFFEVELLNKAGHKFPSGYPSRRVFIEFILTTTDGDTLFKSGVPDSNFEVLSDDDIVEPHYDLINKNDQVQIYEFVPADVNGDVTTVLEQAATALKDNRLAPIGFKKSHSAYDTTIIYGNAVDDDDFNSKEGIEGSGTDNIRYHIFLNGYSGFLNIETRIHYQTIAPRWIEPMFEESSPEIEKFKGMYEVANLSTVVVAQEILEDVFVGSLNTKNEIAARVMVYPNPTMDGRIKIDTDENITNIQVYSAKGERISNYSSESNTIDLPEQDGIYYLKIHCEKKYIWKKVVRTQ